MTTAEFIPILKNRFEKNKNRHPNLTWNELEKKLQNNAEKTKSLIKMELSGGEPDVVGYEDKTGEYIFMDCSKESPQGRRNTCYDRKAMEERKNHPPKVNALDIAREMGTEVLNEEQYRYLQSVGDFDTKTSSWIETPDEIRNLGGALFADRRYDHVFVYHNGADSYYASRGFRVIVKV